MSMRSRSLSVLMIFVTSNVIRSAYSASPECQQMTLDLEKGENYDGLNSATSTMWDKFYKTCETDDSCVFDIKPVAATTHLNFSKLKRTDQYQSVIDACSALGTDKKPTTLCAVNSKLTVKSGEGTATPISDKFTAKREPVCFPYQCSENQVDIVHGKPLGCDPELTECELESEIAICPDRPEGAGAGNCHTYADIINDDETLTSAITALSSKASMACVNFGQDDDDEPICVSETAPIKIYLSKHFRTFEADPSYRSYLDSCYGTDSHTCYMSMAVKMQGQVGFFDLDLIGDYNDYPLCMPKTCTADEKIEHATNLIQKDVGEKMREGMASGFRRKLSESSIDISEDDIKRMLQTGANNCPAVGMSICNFQVMDFYCVERGTETGSLTIGSSDANSMTKNSKSFLAAMGLAVAGGMLV